MKQILITHPEADYELIDSGDGEKLERVGKYRISRPDPQALWSKNLSEKEWQSVDAHYKKASDKGSWVIQNKSTFPEKWKVNVGNISMLSKLSPFKHIGIFPEQIPNWSWVEEKVHKAKDEIEVLNLFGYTGGATLSALKAGAKVVHVDGSKAAISWAKANAGISNLENAPVRWILEDVRSFVKKEIKRDRQYQGIILDPPAFGHGAEKEVWKIEDHLIPLLVDLKKILAPNAAFFLLNGYAAGYSAIAFQNLLSNLLVDRGGKVEAGELTIEESGSKRLLPAGIYSRWSI